MSEEAAGLNRHRLEKNQRANRLFALSLQNTYLYCFAVKTATLLSVLHMVEQIMGLIILLYNITHIIHETHSRSHLSWRQERSYWGLKDDDQVSM